MRIHFVMLFACMIVSIWNVPASADSTADLTPNAAGFYSEWNNCAGYVYTKLQTNDGATTIACESANGAYLSVNVTDPNLTDVKINSIDVTMVCAGNAGMLNGMVRVNGVDTVNAAPDTLTAAYLEYIQTIVNPGSWTAAQMNTMEAGIVTADNVLANCTQLFANVNYTQRLRTLEGFYDEGSDSYTPATSPGVRMAKIYAGTPGGATWGRVLTQTRVVVNGTLSILGQVKVYWNTTDNFSTATLVGSGTPSGLGANLDITLNQNGGTNQDPGYLWYVVELPSGTLGTYSLQIVSITGVDVGYDYLPLAKSTATRSVKPPTQTLEDWRDNAKNYNLNSSPPVTKQLLAKVETKRSSEGKPQTNSNVAILGTLAPSSIGKVQVWWKANNDDFSTATLVFEKTSGFPANGTNFDLTNVANAGLNPGYLYYTIDIPSSSARGSYALRINSVAGTTTDNIPLPKTGSYTFLTNPYAIQVCGDCHAYPPKDGTRSGTSGAVQGTHSTHARFNPMKCRACHKDTTSGETNAAHRNERVQLKSTLGKGGSYSGYTSWPQASSPTMRQCTSVVCHNGVSQTWGSGATMTCKKCHYSTAADTDDFTFDYFTSAAIPKIYSTEWVSRGHGKSTGTYDRTGNNAAKRVCTDCHDDGIGHGDSVKPYKTNGTGNQDVFCLNCHGSSADRGSLFLPYTAKSRDIRTHSQGVFSSVGYANITTWRIYQIKCIDCHDPHGDDNVAMIHKKPWTGGSDQKGRPAAFYNGYSTVRFKKYTGTDGMGMNNSTKFYICEVCHTRTKFHKQGGTDGTTHFNGIKCPDCHTHSMGWAPYKGCVDCHAVARPYLYNVRQITGPGGDFVKLSRHVNDGTTSEIVTNYDCIVCHREGDYAKANAGTGFTSDTLHWDGTTSTTRMVNLRNVDSRDTGWSWNKYVKTEAMRTDLDNFCMACHDSDGASNIAVNATDTGLAVPPALAELKEKPFNSNDNLRNGRDGLTTRTRIVDVKGQFYGGTGGKSTGYNGNPSQHAVIQGRYSANNVGWTAASWVTHTLRNGTVQNTVREKGRLHCSDCHLSETNAHGAANAWHMLLNGTANDFTTDYAMAGLYPATTASIVCYKCHASGVYSDTAAAGSRFTHNQEGRVWSTGDYGGVADNGAKLGPACLICHAGDGFGRIHGRGSATDGDNGQYVSNGVTFTKYRFQPGGYYWYAPGATGDNDWNATGVGTCYLVKSSWVGCSQHAGAKAAANNNYARPVKY